MYDGVVICYAISSALFKDLFYYYTITQNSVMHCYSYFFYLFPIFTRCLTVSLDGLL